MRSDETCHDAFCYDAFQVSEPRNVLSALSLAAFDHRALINGHDHAALRGPDKFLDSLLNTQHGGESFNVHHEGSRPILLLQKLFTLERVLSSAARDPCMHSEPVEEFRVHLLFEFR